MRDRKPMATRNCETLNPDEARKQARIDRCHQRQEEQRMVTFVYEGIRRYAVGRNASDARLRASVACGGDDYVEIEIGPIEVMK